MIPVLAGCADWDETNAELCGNGVIDHGEECDDTGLQAEDGCSPTCTVDRGYTCTNEPSQCSATCGDGIIAVGAEECDDGEAINFDGCSSSCAEEFGWVCQGEPSSCTPGL